MKRSVSFSLGNSFCKVAAAVDLDTLPSGRGTRELKTKATRGVRNLL